MATEAQNILDAFYAENKKVELEEQERELKRGSMGYLGGLPGFMMDTAAGLEAIKTGRALMSGAKELFDFRDPVEKTIDELVEYQNLQSNLESRLKELSKENPEYKKVYEDYFEKNIGNKTIDEIAPMLYEDIGIDLGNLGMGFANRVNKYSQSVRLTSVTGTGQQVDYTVGKFQPGQGMLKRFGQ